MKIFYENKFQQLKFILHVHSNIIYKNMSSSKIIHTKTGNDFRNEEQLLLSALFSNKIYYYTNKII